MTHVKVEIASGETVIIDSMFLPLLNRYTWRTNNYGYVFRKTSKRVPERKYPKSVTLYLHRLVLGLETPEVEADHLNNNKLDNTLSNLAPRTHQDNLKNPITVARINQSRRGVPNE